MTGADEETNGEETGDAAPAWAAAQVPDVRAVDLVKARPWSTVWRVVTGTGPLWLKACPERTRQEVRLLDALSRRHVPHSLTPIATDLERGWVLLPDGGPTVREVPLPGPAAAQRWAQVLGAYAQVQRATERHVEELVALGVPDLRLPRLLDAFEELARRWAPEVLPLRTRLAEEVAELTELGPAAALQHDDLHEGNVFDRGARPFDWGDACVGHPFSSLLVGLDTPDPAPARQAYLAQWPELAGAAADRAVDLGIHLGRITRAHSWERALAAWPDPPPDHRGAPASWLRTLLPAAP